LLRINLKPLARIATLVGEQAQGNAHTLIAQSTQAHMREVSLATDDIIVGIPADAMEPSHSQALLQATFYQHGQAIQFCGSGLLAIAAATTLGQKQSVRIASADASYQVGRDYRGFFVETEYLYTAVPDDQANWQEIIDQPITRVLLVGPQDGYALLVLPSAAAVADAHIDTGKLCQSSRRAVIITALYKGQGQCQDNDGQTHASRFVLRYFAPQYGNDEDAATGSGSIVAGNYWLHQLGATQLHGLQLSATGGEAIITRPQPVAKPELIRLYGQARALPQPDSIAQVPRRELGQY
jgi:predicted PhzF superfamily epimerase YddE/YHI9